jgi:hypothetical protein
MIIYYYKGGDLHGHLGLIMMNDEYFTAATDVFPIPENPGATATIVVGMMAAHITETNWAHTEATRVYHIPHLPQCGPDIQETDH